MKIPYIKIPITDMYAYLAPYPTQIKGQMLEAVLHYGMYQTWPDLSLSPAQQAGYLIVQQLIEREVKNYKKFCKEQKQKIKKYWSETKNADDTHVLPARNNPSKQEQETKQEQENITTSTAQPAAQAVSALEKKISKTGTLPLEFVEQVISRFESAVQTPMQRGVFVKRNARCLKDIFDFCDQDIALALQTISVCVRRLQKAGLTGGYEAVCRNLPEYYEKAKQELYEHSHQ